MLRRFRHPRYESVVRRDLGVRMLGLLLLLLVVTMAILFIIGRLDTARRSGTAFATVVHTRFQPADPGFAQTPQGNQVEYVYVVDGVSYTGADFRKWTDVPAHHPKVCFDPHDPANHLLVDGSIRCGVDAGP